ncbi:MAG: GTP-binding protein [Nitrospira sp.]|nr:GTP-binding protein [Nitrospira sp.]MDH4246050.1 GTP-binding protein [Nitrospira sp.]MDH4358165.1 GTP-binding protein [Nitrospira sp.]MDH5320567.1 GTP-binding protein [Nitrospira sp.]
MIQKKICMLGGFAVGKTSLVRRFVSNVFSDQYQTTIGVTVEKKCVTVASQEIMMVLWDLYGEDEFQHVRDLYLRGSSGYIVVMDGTRKDTLQTALALQQTAANTVGPVPFVSIINKADMRSEWEIDEHVIEQLRDRSWTVLFGSAKLGQGVDELFLNLATQMVQRPPLSNTHP